MNNTVRRIVAAGAAGMLLAGCTDATQNAAPTRPAMEIVNPPVVALTLERLHPLPNDITKSITLYQTGGSLDIPEAGFHLNIPRNTIGNDRITITVTAVAGNQVAYEFYPKGMQFKLDGIRMTQNLDSTSWVNNEGNTKIEGGYFKTRDDLDSSDGTALIYEFIPVSVIATGGRLHMNIKHFSGYVVATGRTTQNY